MPRLREIALGFLGTAARPWGTLRAAGESRRVVVLRLDEIGDVVLCGPLLRGLRGWLPAARIALVVRPAVMNLVELCPYVNGVIAYQRPKGIGKQLRALRHLRRGVRRLLGGKPDLGIVPRFDIDMQRAIFALVATGARRRVGYSEKATAIKARGDRGFDALFTDVLPADGVMHEVLRNLSVLNSLGGKADGDRLELWLSESDRARARELVGTGARKRVAICAGGGSAKRRWPKASFAEIARRVIAEWREAEVVVVGGPGEEGLGEEIVRGLGDRGRDLSGKMSIRESAAAIGLCDLYVGGDTGPMHLAAASGVPVVCVSCHPMTGSATHFNSPERFGPWGVKSRVLRPGAAIAPCADGCDAEVAHCIVGVSVDEVWQAVKDVLTA